MSGWAAPPARPASRTCDIYNKKTGTYEPLDLNRTYALAGMNYTLRNLGDGFAMFDGAELIKDYVSEDYLVMSTYAMIFDAVNDVPVLSSANSPLAELSGLPAELRESLRRRPHSGRLSFRRKSVR